MPSIGAYTVFSIRPGIEASGLQTQEITRPGVNGRAYLQLGIRGVPQTLRVMTTVGSGTTIYSLMANYFGLQGTVVQVTDDWGTTWNNIFIQSVRRVRSEPILKPTSHVAMLHTEWVTVNLSTSF